MLTWYDLLGIALGATAAQVQAAYQARLGLLARSYSPARRPGCCGPQTPRGRRPMLPGAPPVISACMKLADWRMERAIQPLAIGALATTVAMIIGVASTLFLTRKNSPRGWSATPGSSTAAASLTLNAAGGRAAGPR